MLPILPAALHWARPADTGLASALPPSSERTWSAYRRLRFARPTRPAIQCRSRAAPRSHPCARGSGAASPASHALARGAAVMRPVRLAAAHGACLLYTSDAADERSSVDLGGR